MSHRTQYHTILCQWDSSTLDPQTLKYTTLVLMTHLSTKFNVINYMCTCTIINHLKKISKCHKLHTDNRHVLPLLNSYMYFQTSQKQFKQQYGISIIINQIIRHFDQGGSKIILEHSLNGDSVQINCLVVQLYRESDFLLPASLVRDVAINFEASSTQ